MAQHDTDLAQSMSPGLGLERREPGELDDLVDAKLACGERA